MKPRNKLRILGGTSILFNPGLNGENSIKGISVLLMTFGFTIGLEYLEVRNDEV